MTARCAEDLHNLHISRISGRIEKGVHPSRRQYPTQAIIRAVANALLDRCLTAVLDCLETHLDTGLSNFQDRSSCCGLGCSNFGYGAVLVSAE